MATDGGALGGGRGSTAQTDREILHDMGYAQELNRGMGWFSNFAISFSIISILAGGLTSFWLGMVTGGPLVITLGWIIVGFFALLVGMSMGEICSSYPTAGGLYYWSAKLARTKGPKWAWFTGWFNLLGQIGVIASVDYALSVFIAYFIRMFDSGFNLTAWTIFGIYILVLISHGVLNTFGVKLVALLSDISVWWHVVGVGIFFVVLLVLPDNNVGLSHVFDQAPPTIASSGLTGWTGGTFIAIYLFAMGLLLAQYTITGFDASAHVSEETFGRQRLRAQGDRPRPSTSRPSPRSCSTWRSSRPSRRPRTGGSTPTRTAPSRSGAPGQLPRERRAEAHRHRARIGGGQAAHVHRDRGAVLLRHGVRHREQSHDLRVQPRRRPPGQPAVASHQPSHPDTHELDLARRHARGGHQGCCRCTRRPATPSPSSP